MCNVSIFVTSKKRKLVITTTRFMGKLKGYMVLFVKGSNNQCTILTQIIHLCTCNHTLWSKQCKQMNLINITMCQNFQMQSDSIECCLFKNFVQYRWQKIPMHIVTIDQFQQVFQIQVMMIISAIQL
jgi:hypothetical protein